MSNYASDDNDQITCTPAAYAWEHDIGSLRRRVDTIDQRVGSFQFGIFVGIVLAGLARVLLMVIT